MKNVANATNYLDIDTKELFRIYSKDKDNKDYFSYGIYMTIKAALILLVLLFLLTNNSAEYSGNSLKKPIISAI